MDALTNPSEIDVSQNMNEDETQLQEDYFRSYGDLNVHRLMLEDKPRTSAYISALENASKEIQGKIVLDLGAGTGILSLVCAKAGAKKVYAVEASNLGLILPKIIEQNGFSDIIEVIHSKVEDAKLEKESIDIIVSEWMGFYLLHESMLDSVLFARDKFLKPKGLLFPTSCQLYGAPCALPELWSSRVGFWNQKQYGFDFSPLAGISQKQLKPEIFEVPSESLLTEPQLLWELNLATLNEDFLQCLTDRRFFSIDETSDMHGMAIWFTVSFPTFDNDKEDVVLSTAPWDPPTHWKQTVILLPDCINVEEGDIMGWKFSMERETKPSLTSESSEGRSYKLQLELLDENEEHPVPCSCGSVKCEIVKHYINDHPNPK